MISFFRLSRRKQVIFARLKWAIQVVQKYTFACCSVIYPSACISGCISSIKELDGTLSLVLEALIRLVVSSLMEELVVCWLS